VFSFNHSFVISPVSVFFLFLPVGRGKLFVFLCKREEEILFLVACVSFSDCLRSLFAWGMAGLSLQALQLPLGRVLHAARQPNLIFFFSFFFVMEGVKNVSW